MGRTAHYNLRSLVLAIGVAVLPGSVLGCTSARESLATSPPGVANERDKQVLETALLHLLAADDFNFTAADKGEPLIVLHAQTPEYSGMIRPEQIRGEIREGFTIPDGIQRDLLRRNEQPGSYRARVASFSDLEFDQQILVAEVTAQQERFKETRFDAFAMAYPRARGYVEAYLPGYSKDGSHALVRACVGPSPHGAMATILVERSGHKWLVKWCYIALFC